MVPPPPLWYTSYLGGGLMCCIRPPFSYAGMGKMNKNELKKTGEFGQNSIKYKETWWRYGDSYKVTYTPDIGKNDPERGTIHRRDCQAQREEKSLEEYMTRAYERTAGNVSRAKNEILGIAMCNRWDWWVTLTVAPDRADRYDIQGLKVKIAKWMRNQRRKPMYAGLRYILIPEQHKDGAWHLHGMLHGVIADDMSNDWDRRERLPTKIRNKIASGAHLYWWPEYEKRWGWCTLERLKSPEDAARYCAKYAAKSIQGEVEMTGIPEGKNLYLASQGLARPAKISREEVPDNVVLTRGAQWEWGASYWFADPRSVTRKIGVVDYTRRNEKAGNSGSGRNGK